MKHYKSPANDVIALRLDGTQDHLIPDGWVLISEVELAALRAPKLPELKADKRRELKRARTDAIEADVTVGARTWPSDDSFKARLTQLIARIGRGKPAPAKLRGTSGNPINTPTVAQLETIEDAIAAQEEAAWDRYWLRIDALKDATNAAQVAAIVW